MKFIVNICRLLVGALFIFSGFIKLNDPLGFSYKLQEYFSYDVLNIPSLEPYALGISVFVVIFEVVLGVFLLVGYKPKFTVWSLLGMIVFFTFLTFYSAYFDKVKDCGCFGDAIKLTPWESFTKDVILLVLILVLFFNVRYIKPIFSKLGVTMVSLLSFIVCMWFAYHVLMHLPAIDFRAYNIGSNIQEKMSIPEGAKEPVMEWKWLFKVDGEEKEFVTNGSYPSVDGEYISVETTVIEPGYEPTILDFSIESEEDDFTAHFLEEDHLVMVVSYSLESAEKEGLNALKTITDQAIENGYTVIGLSASGTPVKQKIKEDYKLDFDFYLCDEKVLKTIVRSNPGVLVLEKGTIMQKVHWNDVDDLDLPKVARKPEPKVEKVPEEHIVYFINDERATKEAFDALDSTMIQQMEVIKDSTLLKELELEADEQATGAIKVTLKDN
ncbi:BT_3928 family protein [Mangrovimonas sp. YM274]|uniref:BT_3928 family protein n=1 Tax=Mangrovimonas sp. YM274 TaxID=3070660 RepID=UPI0027DB2032|nr:BT_3928 family protein [Mangrovimonas sp. YM274]WMI70177.1 DoxX family protein [Mangrovimonas sp. YM274]